MTTTAVIDILSAHVSALRDDSPLMILLTKVADFEKQATAQCNRIVGADSESSASNNAPTVRSEIASLRERILKIAGFRDVLNAINMILSDIDLIEQSNFLPKFRSLVNEFERAYESLIITREPKSLLEFLRQTAVLRDSIAVRREAFAAVRNLLDPGSRPTDSVSSLRVGFSTDSRVETVHITLDAFAVLYAQIADLMHVSTAQHPLVVQRIERGSSWYDFLGYPRIVAFLTSTLERTIAFVHRNYTKEGKLCNLPKAVDAIEDVLELRNQLKAEGIDVNHVDGQLEAATVKIAGQLNKLMGSNVSIQVNNTKFELREAIEARLVEHQKEIPLLEDQTQP